MGLSFIQLTEPRMLKFAAYWDATHAQPPTASQKLAFQPVPPSASEYLTAFLDQHPGWTSPSGEKHAQLKAFAQGATNLNTSGPVQLASWKPTQGVKSNGQKQLIHAANYYFFSTAVGAVQYQNLLVKPPAIPFKYLGQVPQWWRSYGIEGKEESTTFFEDVLDTAGSLVPGVVLGLATAGIASGLGSSVSSATGLSADLSTQVASTGLKLAGGANLSLSDLAGFVPTGSGGFFDAIGGLNKITGVAQSVSSALQVLSQGTSAAPLVQQQSDQLLAPTPKHAGAALAAALGLLLVLVLVEG